MNTRNLVINLVIKKTDPAYLALLLDEKVVRATCGVLVKKGWPDDELLDGVQETRWRTIRFCIRDPERIPATVEGMKALCTTIALRVAVSRWRHKKLEDESSIGLCEDPDAYGPLVPSGGHRDGIDTRKQLEVVAEVLRERAPEHAFEILEGIGQGLTKVEIGDELGISERAVEGRLDRMRKRFRKRLVALGMEPPPRRAKKSKRGPGGKSLALRPKG